MRQNPANVLRTIQGLIVEFEQIHKGKVVPQVNIIYFLKRLKMAYRHGSKVVARYYIEQFDKIEEEMAKPKLEAESALEHVTNEAEMLKQGLTHCSKCKGLICIDTDIAGWSKENNWHHIGTCPTSNPEEREIRNG